MSRIAPHGEVRQRDPRVRDKAYISWLHEGLRCVSCAVRGSHQNAEHAAHIKVGFPEAGWRAFGHSERGHDRNATALCAACHQYGPHAQHKNVGGDERVWWERLGVYPPTFCAALNAAYEARGDGNEVIRCAANGEFPFPADVA